MVTEALCDEGRHRAGGGPDVFCLPEHPAKPGRGGGPGRPNGGGWKLNSNHLAAVLERFEKRAGKSGRVEVFISGELLPEPDERDDEF